MFISCRSCNSGVNIVTSYVTVFPTQPASRLGFFGDAAGISSGRTPARHSCSCRGTLGTCGTGTLGTFTSQPSPDEGTRGQGRGSGLPRLRLPAGGRRVAALLVSPLLLWVKKLRRQRAERAEQIFRSNPAWGSRGSHELGI